jgi:hypothetical protein
MKRFSKYLFIGILAASCNQKEPFFATEDGMAEVYINVPQLYGHQPEMPGTKSGDGNIIGDIGDRLENDRVPVMNLPEGTTLWLAYEHRIAEDDPGTADVDESRYEEPVLKAYVVKSAAGGYQALYACEHTEEDGKLVVNAQNAATTATPLYLKHDEWYRFRMISPAMKISKEDLSMSVDNGDSFCASDQRYEQTSSIDTKIEAKSSGVNYITLNPMIQQTARLHFVLKKGDNVSSIKMMGDGVEISGIQNPYSHEKEGEKYQWSSMNKADTLVMRLGDKRAWISLPGEKFVTDSNGNLVGDICILPTDARCNTVAILLNMSVNGVPTQYITTLNGMIFEHAKSYNMTFNVGLKNNIVVVNWQNISWTEDIEM